MPRKGRISGAWSLGEIYQHGVVQKRNAIDRFRDRQCFARNLAPFSCQPMKDLPQMLETLPLLIEGLNQQPQPMSGSFVAHLHPGCGLLNGDETMAVDPLEHQPVALGHTYLEALDTIDPYLKPWSPRPAANLSRSAGCATSSKPRTDGP